MKRPDRVGSSKMFEGVCGGKKCCEALLPHFTQFSHAGLVTRPFLSPRWLSHFKEFFGLPSSTIQLVLEGIYTLMQNRDPYGSRNVAL
jgi:hypothetical protein